jgi:hypothetical protein
MALETGAAGSKVARFNASRMFGSPVVGASRRPEGSKGCPELLTWATTGLTRSGVLALIGGSSADRSLCRVIVQVNRR